MNHQYLLEPENQIEAVKICTDRIKTSIKVFRITGGAALVTGAWAVVTKDAAFGVGALLLAVTSAVSKAVQCGNEFELQSEKNDLRNSRGKNVILIPVENDSDAQVYECIGPPNSWDPKVHFGGKYNKYLKNRRR